MKFATAVLLFPLVVSGLRLPIRSVPAKRGTRLSKGKSLSSVKNLATTGGKELNVTNNQDLIYIVDCTIGSLTVPLQLDSGSSDLWVDLSGGKTVQGTASSLTLNLTYGIGFAAGPIATAKVTFAGFDIDNQAYLAGTSVNNPAIKYGAEGVLGMGFTSLSSIDLAVNRTSASWGRSLLYNIFAQNPTEPNFVAYKLDRTNATSTDEGEFTIGEVLPEFSGITETGQISTFPQINPSRWTLLVDKIIASGQTISLSSVVKDAPAGKAVALPDTGTSLVFAPLDIVHAVYGTIPGATYSSADSAYILDCSVEVDVSVVIAGRQFDIHPLDMVQIVTTDSNGNPVCAGTWRPQTLTVGSSDFDFIFGVAFMRSVYSMFDFGDFQSDNKTLGNPYLRLWSVVNGTDASKDFHTVRGGTVNSTFTSNIGVNAISSDPNASQTGTGNAVTGVDLATLQTSIDKFDKLIPILFGLTGLNLLVLFAIGVIFFWRSARRRRGSKGGKPRSIKSNRSIRNAPSPLPEVTEVAPEGESSPGSFIPLPRPRAPAMQNEYRPLSSGSTLRDSQLYDPPKSPSSAKFDPNAQYDPYAMQERYDPAPINRSISEVLPPGDVPFPRQSMAMNEMMPPAMMGNPSAPRHSTADTIVVFASGGKEGGKTMSMSEDYPAAQPRMQAQVPGLTPPEARYDPTARHSLAGYIEPPRPPFAEQFTRRISSASASDVNYDPRRSVASHLTADPFMSPSGPRMQLQPHQHEQLVDLEETPTRSARPSTSSSGRSRGPTPEPRAETPKDI
ncbi:hypothetical protein M422DRAFT_238611 [Sphaerobolus stellatus SS14]|nr:hypothetical protein M422DRAFT_238611 [Sphaerobolus stellatus SS14]